MRLCPWDRMINYTERIALLMSDVVARVPELSFIDLRRVLVFGRSGRSQAEGAYATCHCLTLPTSEPGYYFWKDRRTGCITRRSEWFVTKSPQVHVAGRSIDYLVSFTLPRFCDQTLSRSRKRTYYPGQPEWIAKLDTIVHELYHIDPLREGIRRVERADGSRSEHCHSREFFGGVASMVHTYLASHPRPEIYEFLQYDFSSLAARHGGVGGTTFRSFPSYPQRYVEVLSPQPPAPAEAAVRVDPLRLPALTHHFTEFDLEVRQFLPQTSRALIRQRLKMQSCAA